ncbi:MAG: hypothetical protein AAGK02_13940 [Pseudomonadota bacterium]
MNRSAKSRRGGPLLVFALVLSFWGAGRVMLWENPFPSAEILTEAAEGLIASAQQVEIGKQSTGQVGLAASQIGLTFPPTGNRLPRFSAAAVPLRNAKSGALADELFGDRTAIAGGHHMLLLAALGHVPIPRTIETVWDSQAELSRTEANGPWAPPRAPKSSTDRWSFDGWSFWRGGSNSAQVSQGRVPIYGASQLGARVQYHLTPNSSYDLRAYVRGYRALVSKGESEVGIGASLRPVQGIPVRLFAEARFTERSSSNEVRPSAYVATELPTQSLPLGFVGEAYAQGGYVGGEGATFFADGQASVTRKMATFSIADISVGAAVWGGAQQGASRVDLGPTVRFDLELGPVPARLSVDWREQVAGEAVPSSGVAATISTQF